MGHSGSEFEIKNSEGSTTFQDLVTDGTIGVSTSLPGSPDLFIEKFILENRAPITDERSPNINIDALIEFSLDGTNWDSIFAGQGVELEPKGVQQIQVRSNVSSCPYRLTLVFEKFNEDR